MKRLLYILCISAVAFVSCQKDNSDDKNLPGLEGIVILNNGNMGSNDASISLYDPEGKKVEAGIFFNANSQKLGDLGQDILVDGEDIYIAVNGSKVIFVTDREFVIKRQIEAKNGDAKLSPRSLLLYDKKVYVTYYEGFLGVIDPAAGYGVKLTAVGSSPEGLAVAGGKMYVANSGGANYPNFENTLSVVDLKSFKEVSKIKVNENPQTVVASNSGNTLYVNSFGNYGNLPAKLQAVSISDGSVKDIDYADVKSIAKGNDDVLYVVTGAYDANWHIQGTINVLDMKTGQKKDKFTSQSIENYYSISFDPASGYVFAGSSDYVSNGDLYVFDKSGSLVDKFDTQGLNPIKALWLK